MCIGHFPTCLLKLRRNTTIAFILFWTESRSNLRQCLYGILLCAAMKCLPQAPVLRFLDDGGGSGDCRTFGTGWVLEGCAHFCFQHVFAASSYGCPVRSHPTTDQLLPPPYFPSMVSQMCETKTTPAPLSSFCRALLCHSDENRNSYAEYI